MLTLDVLYAVLHGLSPLYLDHLDRPWQIFCSRIRRVMQKVQPPLEALKLALQQAEIPEIQLLFKAMAKVHFVMQLKDLSFRQKQALIALRYENVASLSQLSRILSWDRSHTYHRLAALVKKGYALKFYAEKGPHYMATYDSLQSKDKFEILRILEGFLHEFRAKPVAPSLATPATPATLATLATRDQVWAVDQVESRQVRIGHSR